MADEAVGGKLTKRQWYVVGGVGAAYVGYRWWKARNSSATATTTGTATQGTPIGVDANGNPVYLNSSGQEVDASGNPDSVVTGSSGVGTSGTGYTNPAPIASDGLPTAGTAPQTDEQWTQAVMNDLEQIGYDPTTVSTAIAQYLASQPLTSAQVTIIRTAWAYEGRPPGEPNLPIIQGGSTGTTGTGTGSGSGSSSVPALKAGQVVQVPVALQGNVTWESTAKKAGITLTHLQENNPTVGAKSGVVVQVPVLVKASGTDATWQSIAEFWGISALHLQQNNPSISGLSTTKTTGTTGTVVTSTY